MIKDKSALKVNKRLQWTAQSLFRKDKCFLQLTARWLFICVTVVNGYTHKYKRGGGYFVNHARINGCSGKIANKTQETVRQQKHPSLVQVVLFYFWVRNDHHGTAYVKQLWQKSSSIEQLRKDWWNRWTCFTCTLACNSQGTVYCAMRAMAVAGFKKRNIHYNRFVLPAEQGPDIGKRRPPTTTFHIWWSLVIPSFHQKRRRPGPLPPPAPPCWVPATECHQWFPGVG